MGSRVPTKIVRAGFPALQHRNFRLFWFGQCISLIGTWMQSIGQSWLVLELTHSALKLSIVTMAQFIPMMLLSLYAGTLVDRLSKRKVLIFTQSAFAILAAVLATVTYFKVVEYWQLLTLALILGIVNTLDIPTRQAFVFELVGKEDLKNAIALNSSIFNLGRVIGPAVAGVLIGLVGIATCFYLNAISFIAVITSLWLIRVPEKIIRQGESGSLKGIYLDINEGLRYINQKEIIKQPLLLLALISTFVMNFNILVPVFAQQELSQNATGYGLLMTSMGIGSFMGSLTLVAWSHKTPKLRYLVGGALGMSFFLVILALEKNFQLACITLFLIGFCSIIFTTLVNTTIQLNSSDEMRGRVMSVYTLVFGGVIPIGSLFAGQLTEYAGAPGCMIISGIIGILATAYSITAMRRKRRVS
ncbi:MAG TPA: MFS transporter [Anaerovoracaceae bacterium]|nr:MFS transporter [Anaerovoracaceae bacterium]